MGIALIYMRSGGVSHTIENILTRATTLFFRLDLDQRSAKEVMGLQNRKSPNLRNFRTPNWES
jgi:hypothetical protein